MYQPTKITEDKNYEEVIMKLTSIVDQHQKEIDFLKSQLNKLKDRAIVNL